MAQGTLRLFNEHKGYGIISPAHGGGDVFDRYSDIRGCREGAERVPGSGRFKKVRRSPTR
jgi:cold shock CspA family protein